MKRICILAAIVSVLGCGSFAATNLVSNTAIVTNRCAQIITYTMSNGVARVQDPTGKLVGTAEEAALRTAAEGQIEIAAAAADAAGTAMEEWREFIRTNDTHVLYIDGRFGQDLPALAANLCGWVASQWYDGTNDHYQIWFNRDLDVPPFIQARISAAGGTNWLDATWKDWSETNWIDKATGKPWTKPYDAEVEYLESMGTQWIDTGVKKTFGTKIDCTFSLSATNTKAIFGARTSIGALDRFMLIAIGTYFRFDTRYQSKPGTPDTTSMFRFQYDGENATMTNLTMGTTDTVDASGGDAGVLNIALFGVNTDGVVGSLMLGRMYAFKIWDNSTLVRDYIPVRVGQTGELYDRVSGQLFGNAGTGAFIYGDDTGEIHPAYSAVPCRELIVPRRNSNCILKHGSTVTFGGRDGFDASATRCNIEVGGLPAATTSLTLPLFYTRTACGTNTIVRAYTNAALTVENGFIHKPVEETTR